MEILHVCAASVIFIETVFGVRKSPIVVESWCMYHSTWPVTVTTCEPNVYIQCEISILYQHMYKIDIMYL